MEYSKLLDVTTELAYQLAMSGAETFRVEESAVRIFRAYGIDAEVFAIPNCLHISIKPTTGTPLTRMRRIGEHGNDLDAVELFTNLSRRLCAEQPDPEVAQKWLDDAIASKRSYTMIPYLAGHFLGAFGFSFIFGGNAHDALFAGICGILVGIICRYLEKAGANQFFRILIASFVLAFPAYALGGAGIANNPDAIIIGTLMLLVPGLLITNALRDIIHGDTNSGINRIVQVILIALSIALGTAGAWALSNGIWDSIPTAPSIDHAPWIQAIACLLGCYGFSVVFNIHGWGGVLCAAGGMLTWLIFLLCRHLLGNDLIAYFFSTVFAAVFSEIMARIRKYPAISYLVISIFPLIPGASVYYTMNYAVSGQMDDFIPQSFYTAAIAGIMAAAILLGSTTIRLITSYKGKP